jgi:hypothetical protein
MKLEPSIFVVIASRASATVVLNIPSEPIFTVTEESPQVLFDLDRNGTDDFVFGGSPQQGTAF